VKVYTPGRNMHVGNESLEVVGVIWNHGNNPSSLFVLDSL
jgi:hypothetical protein